MKVAMKVVKSSELIAQIESGVVPFAVCTSSTEVISKRVQNYLDQYYCENIDQRGWKSYYCHIINAWKCKAMGYESIVFEDGKESKIKGYKLDSCLPLKGKKVVVTCLADGQKLPSTLLAKKVRLKVAETKKTLNLREEKTQNSQEIVKNQSNTR